MQPQEIRDELHAIVDKMTNLRQYISAPILWVWIWDTINDMYGEDNLLIRTMDVVFEKLYEDAYNQGFSLQYGSEALDEHIRDWMFENNLAIDLDVADEEEVEEWKAGLEYGTYVQGR